MKEVKRIRRNRRRRNRIAFHVTLLTSLALGALLLPEDIGIWLLCAVPVACLSAIKLWALYETRRRTPEERRAERQRRAQHERYRNPQHSTVTYAARWNHGFFS